MKLAIAFGALFMAPMEDDSGLGGICGGGSNGGESDNLNEDDDSGLGGICGGGSNGGESDDLNEDDDSGLGGICGGGPDGRESDALNNDNVSSLDGSASEGDVDERQGDRTNIYCTNELMDRKSAEKAEEKGELATLPSRETWTSLQLILEVFNRKQPPLPEIPELLAGLVIEVHKDENISLPNTFQVLRGEKQSRRSTPYDYKMLMHTGFFNGVLDVLAEVKGMCPVCFGTERDSFEESRMLLEHTMHRWLKMHPNGADSVLNADIDIVISNPFVEKIQNIHRGKCDYNSDDEKVNRDSCEDEDTERYYDLEERERERVRHQISFFARHELAELVEYLNRTPYGSDLYERFRQELTARYNRGTYPTVPIEEEELERFLIPRKDKNIERDI